MERGRGRGIAWIEGEDSVDTGKDNVGKGVVTMTMGAGGGG
jgi:hypothetical protein